MNVYVTLIKVLHVNLSQSNINIPQSIFRYSYSDIHIQSYVAALMTPGQHLKIFS